MIFDRTKTSIRQIAEVSAMTCFMNSLLREWWGWKLETLPLLIQNESFCEVGICVELNGEERIWFPLSQYSQLGRHEYGWPLFIESATNSFRVLSYSECVACITDRLAQEAHGQREVKFESRVVESVRAMEEIFTLRESDLRRISHLPKTFLEAEQYLVVGHSFHPTPKSREGFGAADRTRYCPEYKGRFPLTWLAIESTLIYKAQSSAFAETSWLDRLLDSDPKLQILKKNQAHGFELYPMHPWQAEYLLQQDIFRSYLKSGRLIILGEAGDDWYPTSSVRSLYNHHAPYMIKTSLNVRLTNSTRSLLLHEVERGAQVHEVFASAYGRDLLRRYPDFHIVHEPAFQAIIDDNGKIIDESIIICRENPFYRHSGSEGLVLASLTQDPPFEGLNGIAQAIENHRVRHQLDARVAADKWFQAFCRKVLEPLLIAQADYGILLGAHQQNILVALCDDLPDQLYFRDCQGTGYSELAFEAMKGEVESLSLSNGNVLPQAMAHTLFVYYLLINSTFNVITSIARAGSLSETELISQLQIFLNELLQKNPRDPSCLLHLLSDAKLMHKGNFFCSYKNINENTAENPLAIYVPIVNPMASAKAQELPS